MDKVLLDGKICWIDSNEPLTEKELTEFYAGQKVQEANQYLKETDWVNDYKLRHDLSLDIIPVDSSKWLVINKREEYKLFLKGVN